MCVAIHKPKGKEISKDYLENSFLNNEDGAGFCYVKDKKLVVEKGFMKWASFWEAYSKHDKSVEMLIHFRRASVGMAISKEMTHPFFCDTGELYTVPVLDKETGGQALGKGGKPITRPKFEFAIIHNGKLPWRDTVKESDTACFINDVLAPVLEFNPFIFDYEAGINLIGMAIRSENRMAIMRYDVEKDETDIYCLYAKEAPAHKKDGIWYSNYSYAYGPNDPKDKKPWSTWDEGNLRKTGKLTTVYASGYGAGMYEDDDWYAKKSAEHKEGKDVEWKNDPINFPFATPDKWGWYWDWESEYWRNKNTKRIADYLHCRPNKPELRHLGKVKPASVITLDGRSYNECGVTGVDVIVEKAKKDNKEPNGQFSELPKDKRKILQRVAYDYCKVAISNDLKIAGIVMTHNEILDTVRDDVQNLIKDCKGLTTFEVDQWIVARSEKVIQILREAWVAATQSEQPGGARETGDYPPDYDPDSNPPLTPALQAALDEKNKAKIEEFLGG